MSHNRSRTYRAWRLQIVLAVLPAATFGDTTASIEMAERSESARIALVERISPAAVAIFDENERGGGSGVIIDPAGFGLTNFHVVAGMLDSRRGLAGLPDGRLYPLHVLGIDPGGDVAMFRLSGREEFPYVDLGDSDAVRVGDEVLALGNPFLLSEDYTPTVTLGIVSGVNRYQWGAGSGDTLLYSDCIQVDAAINPGNSGGPLFNLAGEVIGINGRISVSMRGRVNVGLGYAITSDQIKAFVPGLRAGLLTAHGTMQAVVRDHHDGSVIFTEIMEDGPAWRCGVRPGDALVEFDGRPVRSANEFASILGTLPADWPVPLVFRHADGEIVRSVARTEAIPVPQQEQFEPDATLNLDEVERALTAYRVACKRGGKSVDPLSEWTRDLELAGEMGGQMLTLIRGLQSDRFDRSRMASLRHAGADRIVTFDGDTLFVSKPLNCIVAPLGEDTEARLLFDADTGALRRIVATDRVTREEVVIDPKTEHSGEGESAHTWASDLLPNNLRAITERTVKLVGARVGRSAGYGCGILVSTDGLVLTIDSALLDGRSVRAFLADGRQRRIEPVWADHNRQLALVRLAEDDDATAQDYPCYDLHAPSDLVRGDWVIAGGNPFKVASGAEPISFARGTYGGTVPLDATRGTQDFPYHGEVLLLDAVTSTPGFAGGALVGHDGRLAGMVGRLVEARTTHTTINYAIPTTVLGEFVAAALDPRLRTNDAAGEERVAGYHGIKFFELGYRENPVYVERVRRGSPAAKAGVHTDDLVIGANGQPVPNLEALERILTQLAPGDALELTMMRDQAVRKISITLEEAP